MHHALFAAIVVLVPAVALPVAAAQPPATPPAAAIPGALFGANSGAPKGTVSWDLLMQARTVQKADRKFGPEFTAEIRALDRKPVKLYGFMMPLDQSQKQKRFLLSPFPPHCAFCLPGGPESLVEVVADQAFDFTYEPILLTGRMAVLDSDLVYYRVTNAVPAKP